MIIMEMNSAYNIILNLDTFFHKYKKEILDCDMIIISGDIFDRLLSPNSKDAIITYSWLARLAKFCEIHNIKLRILEGTPSHDWKQVKLLDEILKTIDIKNLDYKYFSELDIEYIEDLDLHILYIPDEWKDSAEKVYEDVKRKIKEHKLEKVDVVVMHGAFRYQIPNIESPHFHKEEDYIKITNYTINCGHVHNHSQFEKILVPGSFDRLTHADENIKKGGLLVTLHNGSFSYKFLENTNALVFKTIDVTNKTMDEIIKILSKYSKQYGKAHIRLLNKNANNSLVLQVNELNSKFPNLKITITNKNINNEHKDKLLELKTNNNKVVKLDKENLMSLVEDKLNKLELDNEVRDLIEEEFLGILKNI
jgi:DNA repair exonuclease SbcCD nuclease subunit